MKVFVAEPGENGFVSASDYKWCDDGELLMFGQFQLGNSNPTEVSMCGIKTRRFTTRIVVKDLDIDRDFYVELLTESVEGAMDCVISENGDFEVSIGFSQKFNINEIADELLDKAKQFDDGQRVECKGITITKKQE